MRCVVGDSCIACGHEIRELPYWLATTPNDPLLPAQIDASRAPFEDDEERRA